VAEDNKTTMLANEDNSYNSLYAQFTVRIHLAIQESKQRNTDC